MADEPHPFPSPGSPKAIAAGCTCPVIDNHYGAGRPDGFVIRVGCPVHAPKTGD